jgi:hypothetical protein
MPELNEVFTSRYIKADDLLHPKTKEPIDVVVTISDAEIVILKNDHGEDEKKLVLYFRGKEKGLVVNLTNGRMIEQLLGSGNTDKWMGKQIILYREMVAFKGKIGPAIRVRGYLPDRQNAAGVGHPVPQRTADDPRTVPPPKSETDYGAMLDDEVPF